MYQADEKRYETMKYHRCGASGLMMPELSLGLWHNFGDTGVYENMKQMCFTAFDNGITHFDLANNYGPQPGSAEENFGKILREEFSAYRDELIVSTKAGYDMWPGPYVDIFYHHRMDPETPLEETMEALAQIVRSGKALYVGISNYDGETMKRATDILEELHCPFIINQNSYNIFNRTIEKNGLKQAAFHCFLLLLCIFQPDTGNILCPQSTVTASKFKDTHPRMNLTLLINPWKPSLFILGIQAVQINA